MSTPSSSCRSLDQDCADCDDAAAAATATAGEAEEFVLTGVGESEHMGLKRGESPNESIAVDNLQPPLSPALSTRSAVSSLHSASASASASGAARSIMSMGDKMAARMMAPFFEFEPDEVWDATATPFPLLHSPTPLPPRSPLFPGQATATAGFPGISGTSVVVSGLRAHAGMSTGPTSDAGTALPGVSGVPGVRGSSTGSAIPVVPLGRGFRRPMIRLAALDAIQEGGGRKGSDSHTDRSAEIASANVPRRGHLNFPVGTKAYNSYSKDHQQFNRQFQDSDEDSGMKDEEQHYESDNEEKFGGVDDGTMIDPDDTIVLRRHESVSARNGRLFVTPMYGSGHGESHSVDAGAGAGAGVGSGSGWLGCCWLCYCWPVHVVILAVQYLISLFAAVCGTLYSCCMPSGKNDVSVPTGSYHKLPSQHHQRQDAKSCGVTGASTYSNRAVMPLQLHAGNVGPGAHPDGRPPHFPQAEDMRYSYRYCCLCVPIIPITKLLPLWQDEDERDVQQQELLMQVLLEKIKEAICNDILSYGDISV
jgi:hypothetical protein